MCEGKTKKRVVWLVRYGDAGRLALVGPQIPFTDPVADMEAAQRRMDEEGWVLAEGDPPPLEYLLALNAELQKLDRSDREMQEHLRREREAENEAIRNWLSVMGLDVRAMLPEYLRPYIHLEPEHLPDRMRQLREVWRHRVWIGPPGGGFYMQIERLPGGLHWVQCANPGAFEIPKYVIDDRYVDGHALPERVVVTDRRFEEAVSDMGQAMAKGYLAGAAWLALRKVCDDHNAKVRQAWALEDEQKAAIARGAGAPVQEQDIPFEI